MTADDTAQALAAVTLAGESVERAAVEVDRAKWTITALRAERDALAAEVERWVDAHAVLAREVAELRRALDLDDPAVAAVSENIHRVVAQMLGADALAAENARLRAQVQAVEALCEVVDRAKVEPGLLSTTDVRAALATTEAGEES